MGCLGAQGSISGTQFRRPNNKWEAKALLSCETLGKYHYFCEPHFLHLKNGALNTSCIGLLQELAIGIYIKVENYRNGCAHGVTWASERQVTC